ncbi:helix-turn-helix domain-containing protein [Rhizorhabdus histidinilytica]
MVDKAEERSHAALIAEALKSIRKQRRMKPSEVAAEMGMPVRTYEHFEAGTARITYARIAAFARATGSDPVAILAAVPLRSAAFALRSADNKLMTIVFTMLRELNEELGPDIQYIDARTVIGAMDRLAKELVSHVRDRDQYAEYWLREKASKLDGVSVDPEKRKPPSCTKKASN